MQIKCVRDAEKYYDLSSHGFVLNEKRDIKEVNIYDINTGEKQEDTETVFNFVGFTTNQNDDILVSFPKHFEYGNINFDMKLLFNCIMQHRQRRPELYIGSEDAESYASNYPFASFFKVYDYFEKYGLLYKKRDYIKPNIGGRLNWKETISRSEKIVLNGNLIFYPFYYQKSTYLSDFVTACMNFVIEYTVEKFGVLLDIDSTGVEVPEYDFLGEKAYIVATLMKLRQETFKDHENELLESLIDYFSEIKVGGSFYLKHYTFSSIWEDMVNDYLCKYYSKVDSDSKAIIFDKTNQKRVNFEKQKFYTNSAKKKQFISPDHYLSYDGIQLILDAKYYNKVNSMNYKQIAYMFMLMNMKKENEEEKKFSLTVSSLILPSEVRDTKIHFKLDSKFGDVEDFIISEEYLEIKEIMKSYVKDN